MRTIPQDIYATHGLGAAIAYGTQWQRRANSRLLAARIAAARPVVRTVAPVVSRPMPTAIRNAVTTEQRARDGFTSLATALRRYAERTVSAQVRPPPTPTPTPVATTEPVRPRLPMVQPTVQPGDEPVSKTPVAAPGVTVTPPVATTEPVRERIVYRHLPAVAPAPAVEEEEPVAVAPKKPNVLPLLAAAALFLLR